MHRSLIRKPLNKYGHIHRLDFLEAGTEREFGKQNILGEKQVWAGDTAWPWKFNKALVTSSGELWGIYFRVGRSWAEIDGCLYLLSQSLDRDGVGMRRRKSMSWRKPIETLANHERADRWRLSAGI